MAKEVFMPKLGMTQETGTILRWFKREGEPVIKGDLLLEVMTDKINIEVEAYDSGILLKRYYSEDTVVSVNQVIGWIGTAGEVVPDAPPETGTGSANTALDGELLGTPEPQATEGPEDTHRKLGKVRATPAARALARQWKIDLWEVLREGDPNRRIHREDVVIFARSHRTPPSASSTTPSVNAFMATDNSHTSTSDVSAHPGTQLKVQGVREMVGQRMAQSIFSAPHVTLTTDVDMTEAQRLREQLLPLIESETGYRLSYTELIVKSVAHALRHHPTLNASFNGDYIALHNTANIGIAVSVPNGLYVVVIKDVEQKGLAQITIEAKKLAERARTSQLKPDDVAGGTFTVSNLGMYAIDAFTPIINQPESAILGVGRIHEKPVGVNGQIVLRPMMTLSLSFDHRVVDGAPAAAFLTELKDVLEHPYRFLI